MDLTNIPLRSYVIFSLVIIGLSSLALFLMGAPLACECGVVKVLGGIKGIESSQHLFDFFTYSHAISGIFFYFIIFIFGRRLPIGAKLALAVLLEAGWEILENTEFVTARFREATASLDYGGDSIINSVGDFMAMAFGFYVAHKVWIWVSVFLIIAIEVL